MLQIIGGDFLEAEERKTAMSHDEMQDYWETLCSFTGEDIPNEVNQLMAKIRYPRFLYKYRAVNNNNLDALRSNKLFFSKASSYDDPFDTFLHIDVDKIRQEFNSNYSSPEALAALANGMKETFQNQPGIPQEFIQQVTNVEGLKQLFANGITKQFLSYVLTLRSKIQDEILSICFSENGFNETLWLKYADMHKGFCLMYDLSDADSSHCGKLDNQKVTSGDLSCKIPPAIQNPQASGLCILPTYCTFRFSATSAQVPRTEIGTIHLSISSALHFQA